MRWSTANYNCACRPATITTSTTTDTARDDSQHQTVQGGTYDSEVLRIHDGSELMIYWFHLPLLVYHSKFGRLEVTWFPYSSKRVPSWNTNVLWDMFKALEYWTYNGRLQLPLATRDPIDWRWLDMPRLYHLWVFADNYGISRLGNDVIDMLHERLCSSRQLPGAIRYAYAITRPGQMLHSQPDYIDGCPWDDGGSLARLQ
jgi:hypothetical protein